MSELQVTFGEKVRKRRLALGWTQVELAKRVGRRQTEITDLENGHHAPTLKTVERIAEALGVEPKKLL